MTDSLFMFVGQAVAGNSAPKRSGARHALLVFVLASDLKAAKNSAIEKTEEKGWLFVELKRGKRGPDDIDDISDSVLRSAAQSAYDRGLGIVIYNDEIAQDS